MGFQVNITKGDQPPVGASQDDLFIRTSDGAIFYNNGLMFVPITAAPSGAAGGVLSGAYPNPGMAAGAAAANLGAAGGALSGTYPSPGLAAGAATGAALGSDVVKNNAANALTSAGTIDASLASDTAGLKLPSKAGAAPTAAGQIAYDSTANLLVYGNGTATVSVGKTVTNTLGGDVALNNIANFFDGPSCAQGTTGTWLATGSVSVVGTSGDHCRAKLWDGTTVIASGDFYVPAGTAAGISLSGPLATPGGNIRISVRDLTSATASIAFNTSGLSKDSTLTVVRIA